MAVGSHLKYRKQILERQLHEVPCKSIYVLQWIYGSTASQLRFNQANTGTDDDDKTRSQTASKYQKTPPYVHSLFQSLHCYLHTPSPSRFPHHRVDSCENTFIDTDDEMLSSFDFLYSPACKFLVFYNPNEYQYKQIQSHIIAVIWLHVILIIISFILGKDKEKDQQVSNSC